MKLLLCLIYKLNVIINVCIGKDTVVIDVSPDHGLRHHWHASSQLMEHSG